MQRPLLEARLQQLAKMTRTEAVEEPGPGEIKGREVGGEAATVVGLGLNPELGASQSTTISLSRRNFPTK